MPAGSNGTWTIPGALDALKASHEEGLSASQAANKLTRLLGIDVTRNAAIGKAGRIGLGPWRGGYASRSPNAKVEQAKKLFFTLPRSAPGPESQKVHFPRKAAKCAAPEPIILTVSCGPEGGVPFLDLEPDQCHWPLGGRNDPPEKFCGAPKLKGCRSPYCEVHSAIAGRKYAPRRALIKKDAA